MVALTDNEIIRSLLYRLSSSSLENSNYTTYLHSLNEFSKTLAIDGNTRKLIGKSAPSIWPELEGLWNFISTTNSITFDLPTGRSLTLAVARFTRNLITANTYNQNLAYKCEPCIRALVHAYTSFTNTSDPETFIIARFLMQTLSNLITSNDPLIHQIWGMYMAQPEEQNILLRILTHPDDRTQLAALVFIANCITGNLERMQLLITTPPGLQVCVRLLDGLAKRAEAEEASDAEEAFQVGWNIFKNLIDNNLAPTLLSALSMENIIITPQQTTILKIIDTYLLQVSHVTTNPATVEAQGQMLEQLCTLLLSEFFNLSKYAQSSMLQSLGPETTATGSVAVSSTDVPSTSTASQSMQAPLQDLDILLPKVCEALVLITQCFTTMALVKDKSSVLGVCERVLGERASTSLSDTNFREGCLTDDIIDVQKYSMSSTCNSKQLFISTITIADCTLSCADLLRLLDAFLPRIVLGKVSWSTPRPGVPPTLPPGAQANLSGFNYLKRDLVRLLGILCYANRAVQDRVRERDGITVVMNLCVTDELNPYLREHALFTLRNLLHENAENQAVVDAIKPMGTWDENGMLRDTPGTRK